MKTTRHWNVFWSERRNNLLNLDRKQKYGFQNTKQILCEWCCEAQKIQNLEVFCRKTHAIAALFFLFFFFFKKKSDTRTLSGPKGESSCLIWTKRKNIGTNVKQETEKFSGEENKPGHGFVVFVVWNDQTLKRLYVRKASQVADSGQKIKIWMLGWTRRYNGL